jgi:hypothetical protein
MFLMFQLVAKRYNHNHAKMRALSIVEEDGGKRINMAHLVNPFKTERRVVHRTNY